MTRAFAPILAGAALCLAGCGGDPVSTTGQTKLAIVGGDIDTTHDAVVTVYLASPTQGGATCTGTIVSVRPEERIGYVLTAAHCVANFEPYQIVEGGDNTRPTVVYDPLSYAHDPAFSPPQHDFAIIRAVGMDEQTPVIPMTGPEDGLGVGDDVLALGFGATVGRGLPDVDTLRHSLSMKVVAATPDALTLSGYGDTCEGDSGGPILAGTGADERVVGVNSTGDASCFLTSDAARLTSGLSDFVQPVMDAEVADDCLRCRLTHYSGRGECVDDAARCAADSDCVAVRACLNGCSTDDCRGACVDKAGPGVALYFARQHCWCDACAVQCVSEPVCQTLSTLEAHRAAAVGAADDAGAPGTDSSSRPREDSGCSVTRRSVDEPARLVPFVLAAIAGFVRRRRRAIRRSA